MSMSDSESLRLVLSESVSPSQAMEPSGPEKRLSSPYQEEILDPGPSVDAEEKEVEERIAPKRSLIPCELVASSSSSSEETCKRARFSPEVLPENRRESVAVLKVIHKNADTSVIDLISDKEEEEELKAGNSSHEDLFSEDQHKREDNQANPKPHVQEEKSLEEQSKDLDTPNLARMSSSIEFNEKDAYASTPHGLQPARLPTRDSEQDTPELPKEIFIIQISDAKLLQYLPPKVIHDIGPIYRTLKAPQPALLGWEKVDLKEMLPGKSNRLSDASSLSTLSSKISSTGYAADGSSGGSGLSEKRDRTSLIPEARISPHRVVAKLPCFRNTPKTILEDLTSISETVREDSISSTTSKRKKVLRKKKPKAYEKSPPQESNGEDQKEDPKQKELMVGRDVFGKWAEGKRKANYYFGTLSSKAEDKWVVRFSDGLERTLKESDLLMQEVLFPGCSVHVVLEGESVRRAIILSHPIPSEEGCLSYSVEYEASEEDNQIIGESFLVPISKIYLSEDQVSAITSENRGIPKDHTPSLTGGDVSLNNILSTKRTRLSRMTPSKSAKKGGGKFLDTSAAETSCSETPKSLAASRRKHSKSKVLSASTETENDECSSSPSVTRKKGMKNRIIDKGSLFAKMSFILTKTLNKVQASGIDTEISDHEDSSGSSSSTSSASENESKEIVIPTSFSKSEIRSLIQDHGGSVLSSFPGQTQKFPPKDVSFYIISDMGCRTLNFIYGIIHGVTRLSYQWVLDSVREHKLFPVSNYLLPLGYSEILGSELETPTPQAKSLSSLLSKLRVLLLHGDSHGDWKSILVRLGAKVILREGGITPNDLLVLKDVDVVLATSENEDLELLKDQKVSVVSPRWIIQSLINGKKLGYDFFLIK